MGVDGCRAGWVVAMLGAECGPELEVLARLDHLNPASSSADLLLIDMPIGFPGISSRRCDIEARRLLGSRASSIFPVPCRATLAAGDYEEACRINRRHIGVALSKQTWNIAPKMRELDDWLRQRPGISCRECHPELAFWALNGHTPMVHAKRSLEGKVERLSTLRRYLPTVDDFVADGAGRYRRTQLGVDDVLDALVLAVTGWLGADGLDRVPSMPEFDDIGLPMEIVFAHPYDGEAPIWPAASEIDA